MDDIPWPSDKILYKPVGSSGNFVRCRWCNNSTGGHPSWMNSTEFCNKKKSFAICVDKIKNGVRDLQFSSFMQSEAGKYTCKGKKNTDLESIVIEILFPPIITTHPTSQLTTASLNVNLTCEGTGRGSITYHWETKNINGGQWMNISDSNSKALLVSNFKQSQQYRCVVSNEAGRNTSNAATITVLSKYNTCE